MSGDLFTSPATDSLAHCVSKDMRLGKGIAKIFRDKFGRIDELKKSGAGVTDIAVLKDGKRFIYNLVTKEVYHGKPTYDSLRRCLEKMRDHALANKVTNINMPRIGCGLDLLQWPAVRTLIKNVFKDTSIIITVYSLETTNNKPEKQNTIANMFSKGEKSKKDNKKPRTDVGFGYSTINPLPDVFNGTRLYMMSDDIEDIDNLKRYAIAYGATIVEDKAEATHIIYKDKSDKIAKDCDTKCMHVTFSWLEDSIKLKSQQDERLYKVKK